MVIIHVGFPKTGSTTLQHFFAKNEAALAEHGILYPVIGRGDGSAHRDLVAQLRFPDRANGAAGTWRDLQEFARLRPDCRILLSKENFCGLKPKFIKEIQQLVEPRGIRILAYVRTFSQQMVSFYSQRTKFGKNDNDFDSFFGIRLRKQNMQIFELLKNWADYIGWENVRVRALDARSLEGGDLILDAMAAMGLPADAGRFEREEAVNVSPGWRTLELVRAASLQGCFAGRMKGGADQRDDEGSGASRSVKNWLRLCHEVGFDEDRGRYLTVAQSALLNDLYSADIEKLNAAIKDTELPEAAEPARAERAFLPDLAHIPRADLEQLLSRAEDDDLAELRPALRTVVAAARSVQ